MDLLYIYKILILYIGAVNMGKIIPDKLFFSSYRIFFYSIGILLAFFQSAYAEPELPDIIGSNMVLQQSELIHLWGRAEAGEQVTVRIYNVDRYQEGSVEANTEGRWTLSIPPLVAGIYQMSIKGETQEGVLSKKILNNIALGEVWLAAGQSNMEWPLKSTENAQDAIEKAIYPDIRFFKVTHGTALTPKEDVLGYWQVITPDNVPSLSAVAYYFSRILHRNIKQPVGIIQSAWGSTKIEAWMDKKSLVHPSLPKEWLQSEQIADAKKQEKEAQLKAWEALNYAQDLEKNKYSSTFSEKSFDDTQWKEVKLPIHFNAMGFKQDGAVWFRRTIHVPADWKGAAATMQLGAIDDFDTAYVNGVEVGSTDREQAHHWLHERRYRIPEGILEAGVNTIAIRVFDQFSDGGFSAQPSRMKLMWKGEEVMLSGIWRYKVAHALPPKRVNFATRPKQLYGIHNRNTPSVLYNTMIAGLTSYALRGVIWYQGESNVKYPAQYQLLFSRLIKGWRQAWGDTFPFLFVQLANFSAKPYQGRQQWAELRDVQSQIQKDLANTGMITAVDVGDSYDIHPKNKKVIGERLAHWALARVYKKDIPHEGPRYHTATIEKMNADVYVRITLDHAKGLHSKGDITGFELSGKEGIYYPAKVSIENNTLLLFSQHVTKPRSVRYAWHNNPKVTLYNQDGLPLKPFEQALR